MQVLPGLGLAAPSIEQPHIHVQERQINLAAGTEWRFEVSFTTSITVKVLGSVSETADEQDGTNSSSHAASTETSTAEIFGTELAQNHPYTFTGTKAAIYTHFGCILSVTDGVCENEYIAEETPMTEYINLHFALEGKRNELAQKREQGDAEATGPRVLILGPENVGKTALIKILSAYAIRSARAPLIVNLNPREGMMCLPGSISATVLGPGAITEVEHAASGGWGSSPIAGPTSMPVKMPLVYHYGWERPDDRPEVFRPVVTRLALAVTSRLEGDPVVKDSGLLMELSGKCGIETIAHVVSEFSVNMIIVLGSERLYSNVSRHFSQLSTSAGDEPVEVIKVNKSGGCVDRDEAYMRALRHASIRDYFFGSLRNTLSPHTHLLDTASLKILRMHDASDELTSQAFLPGGSLDDGTDVHDALFETTSPSLGLQNALLAIKHVTSAEHSEAIRDASVAGYLYIADIDEVKKKVKVLSPVGGRLPNGALVWGRWPEGIADLLG